MRFTGNTIAVCNGPVSQPGVVGTHTYWYCHVAGLCLAQINKNLCCHLISSHSVAELTILPVRCSLIWLFHS